MKSTDCENPIHRNNSNTYAKAWRLNNTTADRSSLAAARDEAEAFFEREVTKEQRSASGKTFDDFFQEVEESIEWV